MFSRILYFIGVFCMLSFASACAESQPAENEGIRLSINMDGYQSRELP